MSQSKTKLAPRRQRALTASRFEGLSDNEKERIYQEIDAKAPGQLLAESKPLTPRQRAKWNKIRKNLGGRPKHGKFGTQIISVTVEKELLKRANAFAKANGLKRSELVAQGLKLAMREQAA